MSSKKRILLKLEAFFATISLESGCDFLVAFSGGCDSLCLLSSLNELFPSHVAACYVNHHLRSDDELEKELALNEANCRCLGVPLYVRDLQKSEIDSLASDAHVSIEAAARSLRYRELEIVRVQISARYIVTAHTASDQSETLAMRLVTGSTFQALAGIFPSNGVVLRPFLAITREENEAYCKEEGFCYSDDSTNDADDYLRNRVRHHLLPELRTILPDVDRRLQAISRNVQSIVSQQKSIESEDEGGYRTIVMAEFATLSPLSQLRTIFKMHQLYQKGRMSERQLKEVLSAIKSENGQYDLGSYVIRLRPPFIAWYPALPSFVLEVGSIPQSLPQSFFLDRGSKVTDLSIDPALIKGKLIIRDAREGDSIQLIDRLALVSLLMRDEKVPFAFVLEDQGGIVAVFMQVFGGKDRLSRRFLSLAPKEENRYIVLHKDL